MYVLLISQILKQQVTILGKTDNFQSYFAPFGLVWFSKDMKHFDCGWCWTFSRDSGSLEEPLKSYMHQPPKNFPKIYCIEIVVSGPSQHLTVIFVVSVKAKEIWGLNCASFINYEYETK